MHQGRGPDNGSSSVPEIDVVTTAVLLTDSEVHISGMVVSGRVGASDEDGAKRFCNTPMNLFRGVKNKTGCRITSTARTRQDVGTPPRQLGMNWESAKYLFFRFFF